jgi:hypothetical protein
LLPVLFFLLGFIVSAVGPGAVRGTALVIPLAMALGERSLLPRMLTALMVANGAKRRQPVTCVRGRDHRQLTHGCGRHRRHEWKVMLANLLAHAVVAAAAYLFRRRRAENPRARSSICLWALRTPLLAGFLH